MFTTNQITSALAAYRSAADQDTATASSIAAALLSYYTIAQVDGLLAGKLGVTEAASALQIAVRFPDDGGADEVVAAIGEQILGPTDVSLSNWTVRPSSGCSVVLATHTAGVSVDGYTLTLAANPWNIVRTYNLTPGRELLFACRYRLGTASNFVVHMSEADNVYDPLYGSFAGDQGAWSTAKMYFTVPPNGVAKLHFQAPGLPNQTAGTVDVYGLQILDATLETGNTAETEEDTAASALLLKHEFLDGGADDVTLATLGEVLLEPTLTTLGNFLVRSNSQSSVASASFTVGGFQLLREPGLHLHGHERRSVDGQRGVRRRDELGHGLRAAALRVQHAHRDQHLRLLGRSLPDEELGGLEQAAGVQQQQCGPRQRPGAAAAGQPEREGLPGAGRRGAPVRAHHDQRRGAGADQEPLHAAVPDHEPEEPRLPRDRGQHGQRGLQHELHEFVGQPGEDGDGGGRRGGAPAALRLRGGQAVQAPGHERRPEAGLRLQRLLRSEVEEPDGHRAVERRHGDDHARLLSPHQRAVGGVQGLPGPAGRGGSLAIPAGAED